LTTPKEQPEKKPVEAVWNVSICCDCPHCGEYVDLTDEDEFWLAGVGYNLKIAETKTGSAWCPKCGEKIEVELVW